MNFKAVSLSDIAPIYQNEDAVDKRRAVVLHAYNNYTVVDKVEYKGETYFIVEDDNGKPTKDNATGNGSIKGSDKPTESKS